MRTIRKRLAAFLTLALFVAACGSSSGADTTPAPVTTTTSTVATTPPGSSAPRASTTTSIAPTSSTSTTPPGGALPGAAVPPLPILADGRPATFLAVTDDFEAVEVDTESGVVLRSLGQADDRATMEAAEVAATVSVIDGVWRTRDGLQVLVSVCCEPASGLIFYLGPTEVFQLNPAPSATSPGWAAATSPLDGTFAVIGYEIRVVDGDEDVYREDLFDRFGGGAPTYSLDGSAVYWLTNRDAEWWLEGVVLSRTEPRRDAYRLDWVDPDGRLSGLTADADGNYVTFQTDDAFGITRAMVMSPTGELVESYEVQDRSIIGSYDATGTFLIYTDGLGVIRWRGNGEVGDLGTGYLFATW